MYRLHLPDGYVASQDGGVSGEWEITVSGDYRRSELRLRPRPAFDRQQRLQTTIAAGAAIVLVVGIGIGFALGRATAAVPKDVPVAQAPAPAAEPVAVEPTDTIDAMPEESFVETASAEATEEAPILETPKPKAPKDDSTVSGSRVKLDWSDIDGDQVTYAFEIQNRKSDGTYGNAQVIENLTESNYSARVIPSVKRRWRVWAIDATGQESEKSGWHHYTGKALPKPKPKPKPSKPSTETTS